MRFLDTLPRAWFLDVGGRRHELRPYNSKVAAECHHVFATEENKDGVAVLNERLSSNCVQTWNHLAFILLKDKSVFDYDFDKFWAISSKIKDPNYIPSQILPILQHATPPQYLRIKKKTIWNVLLLTMTVCGILLIF